MQQHEQLMQQCGMGANEAKTYLGLLELGSSSAGTIAKHIRLHRPNVYQSLERLLERGLVSYVGKKQARIFTAASPERLLIQLREHQQQIEQLLPQLLIRKHLTQQGKVQIFEGLPAVRQLFEQWLQTGEPILAFGIPEIAKASIGPFLDQFHRRRIRKKIMMRHIYNENAQERIQWLNSLPNTAARYLPKEYNAVCATQICGNSVTLIHWSAQPLIISIEHKEIADTYRKYFEVLWNVAKI